MLFNVNITPAAFHTFFLLLCALPCSCLYHIFILLFISLLYKAEIGDFDANKHNYGYVSEFRIMASQTKDFELRVADIHKQLKGIGPAQTEFNYLDKVKWLDMYGVDLHPVLVSLHL